MKETSRLTKFTHDHPCRQTLIAASRWFRYEIFQTARSGANAMAEAKVTQRPLSPHLQVYRWTWTMAMSVFHRVTGTGLYFGIALLAIWLVALAAGPDAFEAVQWF